MGWSLSPKTSWNKMELWNDQIKIELFIPTWFLNDLALAWNGLTRETVPTVRLPSVYWFHYDAWFFSVNGWTY